MKNILRRTIDIVFSFFAIVLLLPIFAIIAIIVKLNDKGPSLFVHDRVGKGGKPFAFYKFRSMKLDVNPYDLSPKSGDDPRLIRCGKFLREYSLDELPQFFNILKGDMSIVGPRPLYISQVEALSDFHRRRLEVKPGLVGFSQIYMRSELTSKRSLDHEVEYVQNQSFWLDIKLLFKTIGVVLGRKGVY